MNIGDKVKVIDRGRAYTNYRDFADYCNLKKWKFGRDFEDNVHEQIFTVKKIETHLDYHDRVLCVIADENNWNQRIRNKEINPI